MRKDLVVSLKSLTAEWRRTHATRIFEFLKKLLEVYLCSYFFCIKTTFTIPTATTAFIIISFKNKLCIKYRFPTDGTY